MHFAAHVSGIASFGAFCMTVAAQPGFFAVPTHGNPPSGV
jgi:hypothetical protein